MGNLTSSENISKESSPPLLLCPCCLSSIPLITIDKSLKIDIKCDCKRRQIITQIKPYIAKLSQCHFDKMIIEKLKNTKKCKLHNAKIAMYYCEICEEEICSSCKNNEHFNHKVSFISDYCKNLLTMLISQYERNKTFINQYGDIDSFLNIVIKDIQFYHIENNINLLKTGLNFIHIASFIKEKEKPIEERKIENNGKTIKKELTLKKEETANSLCSIKYRYNKHNNKKEHISLAKGQFISKISFVNKDTIIMNIISDREYPLKMKSSFSIVTLFPFTIHYQTPSEKNYITNFSVYIDITQVIYIICWTSQSEIVILEYKENTKTVSQKESYKTSIEYLRTIINVNKQNAFLLFDYNQIHIYDIYNLYHNKTSQLQFRNIQSAVMFDSFIFIYYTMDKNITIIKVPELLFTSDFVNVMTVYTNSIVSSLCIKEKQKNALKGIVAMFDLEIDIIEIDIEKSNYKVECRLNCPFFVRQIQFDYLYDNLIYVNTEHFQSIKRIDVDSSNYEYDGIYNKPISIITSLNFHHPISFESSIFYNNIMILYGYNELYINKYIH